MNAAMVKYSVLLAAVGALSMTEVRAEEARTPNAERSDTVEKPREKGPHGKKGPRPPSREAVLEKYDTNGDGELSDAELEALKADRAAEREKRAADGGHERPGREEVMKRFDADGDGELSESERQALREAMEARRGERPGREEMIQKFDADGDGKLNEEERAEARKAMEKRHGKRGKQMMEKYDTDGDGTLSEDERAAAKADFEKRKAQREQGAPDA